MRFQWFPALTCFSRYSDHEMLINQAASHVTYIVPSVQLTG